MSATGLVLFFSCIAFTAADEATATIVTVNGQAITVGDVNFALMQDGVATADRDKFVPKVVERLIDRQLVRSYLASQKIDPPEEELQFQIAKAEAVIRKGGEQPAAVFEKLGYTPERLKSELGLMLAWQVYIRKSVTQAQIKEYFEQHKQELDGTQLRASQIFLKLPQAADAAAIDAKKKMLSDLRHDLLAKKMTFADAARKFSESPTRERGGDLGLFGWQGKVPAAVSRAAFALKLNDISEPIVSPFGVHLLQVTERQTGDFSLEDVRPVILERFSQQIWTTTVEKERATARIERNPKPQ